MTEPEMPPGDLPRPIDWSPPAPGSQLPWPAPPAPAYWYPPQPYGYPNYQPYGNSPHQVVPATQAPVAADGPGVRMARHPHDEPQEHHRLLRTPRGRGWMPPVGVLTLIVLYIVAALIALMPFILWALSQGSSDGLFPTDSPLFLLQNNVGLIVGIPVAFLTVWLVHRERPGFLSSVTGRLRWPLFGPFTGYALLVQFLAFVLILTLPVLGGLDAVTEEAITPPEPVTVLAFLVVILLTTPLQAAAEEYVFRGYLSQAVGYFARSWLPGAIFTGLLFAAAHGSQDPAAFVDRFAFGFLASYVTWRSGGLEAAIADHAVNNVVILGLGAFAGNPLPDPNIQTTLPWPLVGVDLIAMAAYAGLVTWHCRRRPPQRRSTVLASASGATIQPAAV